ncbi:MULTISPECIES: hypothetical protein [Mesorhizobium]|uniref:hypothetical protein n=1 Tax=Mesorhizobium TaxID=68287 RepID=UPI0010A94F9D|nr:MULTISPECIES: hypothetical protein [Mesorhizobium]
MPKMEWNDFIDQHKLGHGLSLLSRLKVRAFDAQGKKPETVRNVLTKTVKAAATGDWTFTTQTIPKKAGGGTFYTFMFAVEQDVRAVAKAIGATAFKASPKPVRPLVTHKTIGELLPPGYDKMSAALAKAAAEKKKTAKE